MMNRNKSVLLLGAVFLTAASLLSCKKSADVSTTIYTQAFFTQTSETNPELTETIPYTENMRVFGHELDMENSDWELTSYEDAGNGILTNKVTGEKKDPDHRGLPSEYGYLGFGPVKSENLVVIAWISDKRENIDEEELSKMYARRQIELQPGLDELFLKVTFSPLVRKDDWQYEGKWYIKNDNPLQPISED